MCCGSAIRVSIFSRSRRTCTVTVAEGYHLFSAKLDDCIKPLIVMPTN
jgi:hypothetical protein